MALVPFRDPRTGGSRSVFDREGGLFGNISLLDLLDNTRKRIVRALLAVAIERSPFHARRLSGIDPTTFELADLARLPVMTKAEMMHHFDDMVI